MDEMARATSAAVAYGEGVWSWSPDAGIKCVDDFTRDGGYQARTPGRARHKPLKPLRRECRLIRLNLW